MHEPTHYSTTAYAYAQSLLDVANERKEAEPVESDLQAMLQIIDENPLFKQFLADPAIKAEDRQGLLERVFQSRVVPIVWNFLKVLLHRDALPLFQQIAGAYEELLEQQLGKVEVDVTVAQRLSTEELENVRQRISTALKRDAVLHQYVDDSVIAGLVLRVGDTLIDGSVKAQLQSMKQQLLAAQT
ncbi:MAG TPA: ATP synthase F1 subunit delta [Tepidisphaeraceae bacterium]|nr:ATP synthase F1 subunit delta [Tepidisphaeraceae bacterium]